MAKARSAPDTEIILDSHASSLLGDAFQRRGWVFVKAPSHQKLFGDGEKIGITQTVLSKAEKFFRSEEGVKMRYHCPPDFGYYATRNGKKQGIKLLTGVYASHTDLPSTLRNDLLKLSRHVDQFAQEFLRNQLSALGLSQNQLQSPQLQSNVPILRSSFGFGARGFDEHPYGMLDIAFYSNESKNDKVFSDDDMRDDDDEVVGNVAPHMDPGLLSLSFGSTAEGLEMYDPELNKWFQVPNDKCVLWLGSAASDLSGGRVKAGIHRVTYGNKPRLTMWYETCTADQVPPTIREKGLVTRAKQSRLESIRTEKPFSITVKTLKRYGMLNQQSQLIKIDNVYPSSTVYDILLELSEREGLPPAKSRLTPLKRLTKHRERALSNVLGIQNNDDPLVMEHEKTAKDYGLQEGSVLEMLGSRTTRRNDRVPYKVPSNPLPTWVRAQAREESFPKQASASLLASHSSSQQASPMLAHKHVGTLFNSRTPHTKEPQESIFSKNTLSKIPYTK